MTRSTNHRLTDAEVRFLDGSLAGLSGNGHRVEVVGATTIRLNVYRLALVGAPWPSVVVKRLPGLRSELERNVTGRWLPAVGLDRLGPPRLLAVGDPDGLHTWHVYTDLGACGLDRPDVDAASIAAAMDRVAELHVSFSKSPMLPEPRFAACDMGAYYYRWSVRDALRSVDRLRPPAVDLSPGDTAVRDGMLELLTRLADDEPARLRMLEEQAGPETLVHGDLTRANVFVVPDRGGPRVCLIDWDRCGVAPAGFDISTHVAYYEEPERQFVLDAYTTAMAERGVRFPGDLDWELLVQTFEAGRLANQIIWVALGIQERNGWDFTHLSAWSDELAAVVGAASANRSVAGQV